MAAVWTACTKELLQKKADPGANCLLRGFPFSSLVSRRHNLLLFPQKNTNQVACFLFPKKQHPKTTFHHTFHHKITTKNHPLSLTFSKNPLEKRQKTGHSIFC